MRIFKSTDELIQLFMNNEFLTGETYCFQREANKIPPEILDLLYQFIMLTKNIQHGMSQKIICQPHLTPRENQCLFYLTQGWDTKSIAKHLNLSTRTIESYILKIKQKHGVRTILQLLSKQILP